jgi:hypothetical protein
MNKHSMAEHTLNQQLMQYRPSSSSTCTHRKLYSAIYNETDDHGHMLTLKDLLLPKTPETGAHRLQHAAARCAHLGHVLPALGAQQVHNDILVAQVLKAGADLHLVLQLSLQMDTKPFARIVPFQKHTSSGRNLHHSFGDHCLDVSGDYAACASKGGFWQWRAAVHLWRPTLRVCAP